MLYFCLIFSFWFYSCNHIWILLFGSWQGLNKGEATQKDYIIYKSPVPVEDGATETAVARTQRETQEKLPLSLALISRQDIVTNVKEGPLDQASGPTSK